MGPGSQPHQLVPSSRVQWWVPGAWQTPADWSVQIPAPALARDRLGWSCEFPARQRSPCARSCPSRWWLSLSKAWDTQRSRSVCHRLLTVRNAACYFNGDGARKSQPALPDSPPGPAVARWTLSRGALSTEPKNLGACKIALCASASSLTSAGVWGSCRQPQPSGLRCAVSLGVLRAGQGEVGCCLCWAAICLCGEIADGICSPRWSLLPPLLLPLQPALLLRSRPPPPRSWLKMSLPALSRTTFPSLLRHEPGWHVAANHKLELGTGSRDARVPSAPLALRVLSATRPRVACAGKGADPPNSLPGRGDQPNQHLWVLKKHTRLRSQVPSPSSGRSSPRCLLQPRAQPTVRTDVASDNKSVPGEPCKDDGLNEIIELVKDGKFL